MAFGVKIRNIKTQKAYTIEELYEVMKTHNFSAGEPSLTKHGAAMIITFPALDRQNQVWVMKAGFKAGSQKFSIQKSQEAGVGNVATNMVLDTVTKGLFGFGSVVGQNVKDCEKLVETTAAELEALKL
ncbi:MAG: hypothetical protein RSA73_02355 [Anaerovoracaceae bacterium]